MKTVLVLNADFSPLKHISWQKAIVQSLVESKQGSYVVEYYDEWVILDTSGRKYQVPAVVALKEYVDISGKKAAYCKANVHARDMNTCQYCQGVFAKNSLTLDHVIPRSRWKQLGNGGKVSCFENVVSCCESCNKKKADRTCKEADMYPISTPRSITRREAFMNKIRLLEGKIPKEWSTYLVGFNK